MKVQLVVMSVISLLPVGNAGLYIELVSYLLILRTCVLLESNGALVSHSPSLLIFSLLPSYGLNPDVIKVLQLGLFQPDGMVGISFLFVFKDNNIITITITITL